MKTSAPLRQNGQHGHHVPLQMINMRLIVWLYTCPLNQNDVFRIGQRVRPIFLNSGHLIGSGDMCPQIKSIYFLVLLAKKMGQKGLQMGL